MKPPYETFKGPTCRGSLVLGNGCGHCEKCAWERRHNSFAAPRPTPYQSAEQIAGDLVQAPMPDADRIATLEARVAALEALQGEGR